MGAWPDLEGTKEALDERASRQSWYNCILTLFGARLAYIRQGI